MRIGIMLRAIDEKGGVGVYTRYITKEMLEIDQKNEYYLYYRNADNIGTFSDYPNVTERFIPAHDKFTWDQIKIPFACLRDHVQVLFHPKFTVPLLSKCKTVMVLHGAGWFMPGISRFWRPLDLEYIRIFMPLYCRRSTAILSVSQITTDFFVKRYHLPPEKVKTVYLAPGRQFSRVTDKEILDDVRARYQLPERFIFTLTRYPGGDRKNIDGIFKAYELFHGQTSHKLIIGGANCEKYRHEYDIPSDGFGGDILFPGYIAQDDLPAVYSLADLYLYPSHSEAFPIPVTEAMACGTPVITSNKNGLKEISDGAAFSVDDSNPEEIAHAMTSVLTDTTLRNRLIQQGLEKSKLFSWDKCARDTLTVIENLAR